MKIEKLFKSYRKWIQGKDARVGYPNKKRDIIPRPCEPESLEAQCWCLRGAVMSCYPPAKRDKVFRKLVDSIIALFPKRLNGVGYLDPGAIIPAVVIFNDHPDTRFREIIAVVKHAKV